MKRDELLEGSVRLWCSDGLSIGPRSNWGYIELDMLRISQLHVETPMHDNKDNVFIYSSYDCHPKHVLSHEASCYHFAWQDALTTYSFTVLAQLRWHYRGHAQTKSVDPCLTLIHILNPTRSFSVQISK